MSGTIEAAQRDLSDCHEKLGNVLQASGDLAGARETYQNGMVIDLKLAREGGNAHAQRDLAASYNRLGNVLQASGDLVGAREAYENDRHNRGVNLAARRGERRGAARSGAKLQCGRHDSPALEDAAGARDALEKGLAVVGSLIRNHPKNLDYALSLDRLRIQRALSLARLGDDAQATAEAGEVVERVREDGENLYNVACGFSLASAAVAKDGSLPHQDERSRRAEQHAARAVAILPQARDTGLFKDPANIAHMTEPQVSRFTNLRSDLR